MVQVLIRLFLVRFVASFSLFNLRSDVAAFRLFNLRSDAAAFRLFNLRSDAAAFRLFNLRSDAAAFSVFVGLEVAFVVAFDGGGERACFAREAHGVTTTT